MCPDASRAVTGDKEAAAQVASSGACRPGVCTELTKYIVMNAVDIALSCWRRTQQRLPPSDCRGPTGSASLIDAFIDLLSNEVSGII